METTLYEAHIARHGWSRGAETLAYHILCDKNIALLETLLRQRVDNELGPLAPKTVAFGECDAIAAAVNDGVDKYGSTAPTIRNLVSANQYILDNAAWTLSVEMSTFHRWEEFRKHGVHPAMIERPEFDQDHMNRLENTRTPFGLGLFGWNPVEEHFGGVIHDWYYVPGSSIQDITGSDDMRVRVVPYGPLWRQENISGPSHGVGDVAADLLEN